jgi:hypothetical protein
MATKPPYNFAGGAPAETTLDAIKADLMAHPRRRHFAVVEIASMGDSRHHADDEPMQRTMVIQIVEIDPITIPDDINTVRAARDRARLDRPGQGTLDGVPPSDDELSARRAGMNTAGGTSE